MSELLESGQYKAKIKYAKWITPKYNNPKFNPDGRSLNLLFEVKTNETYKDILSTIDVNQLDKLNNLRNAAGLSPITKQQEFKTEKLRNVNMFVEIAQYTGKSSGKTTNIITDYLNEENVEQSEPEVNFSDNRSNFDTDIPF